MKIERFEDLEIWQETRVITITPPRMAPLNAAPSTPLKGRVLIQQSN